MKIEHVFFIFNFQKKANDLIQLCRERLSEKKAKVHAIIPKSNLGYDHCMLISQINTSNPRCLVRTATILDGGPYG